MEYSTFVLLIAFPDLAYAALSVSDVVLHSLESVFILNPHETQV